MAPQLADALRQHPLVLFDLDDTLCDYSLARMRRLSHVFTEAFQVHGRELAADEMDELITRSIGMHPHGVDHFPDLLSGYGIGPEAIGTAQAWYRTNSLRHLALFGEARAALAAVRGRTGGPGYGLGIITNGPAGIQRRKIELLGVEPLVDFIIVSGEFGVDKPDPSIFREALRRGGVGPGDALYIGDSAEHDIVGARAAGLTPVWVQRDGAPWTGDGPEPGLRIRNVGEVAAALRSA
jgi:HAD superfamily hydrolase (TIGR01549 family)